MLLVPMAEGGSGHPVSVDFTKALPEHGSLVLTLDNTGVIRGSVVDARRKPVPDAVVNYLEMKDGDESPAVLPAVETGDDQGRFTIRGLKSGALYHVSAVRPQNGDFVVREAWVRARPGEDVTLRIADEGSIVGRVVVDRGRSPAGLRVVDPATSASTVVTASGKFRLAGLPPTHYNLRISGSGVADAFVHNVVVEEGKETDVGDVQVRAGRTLAGLVVSPLGVGVDSATVRVVVDGQYRLQTISGADGRFRFAVPSASKLVLSAAHKSGDSKQVPLDGSDPPQNVRLALEAGGTIRGTVMASGKPMEGAPVVVYRAGPRPAEPTRFAQVDAAGSYRFDHVPPGKYDVELMWPAEKPSDLRVYYKSVSVETGQAVDVSFDGTAGPSAGTRPPLPAERDIPIYENEGEGG
jgi:protocatechuate 3,4-dioxygenase beta subunit